MVAVDYFTKWVEVEPLVQITAKSVHKFFWKNVVCHFGVPMELTVDNSNQFEGLEF